MKSDRSLWLGYAQTGGRASFRDDEFGGRLLLLGGRSDEAAAVVVRALREAAMRAVVLDLGGSLGDLVPDYPAYDFTYLFYDACELEEQQSQTHGQLMAAAYAAALDLTYEEEAIVHAAILKLAEQDTLANPMVLFDKLASVEGFRGFYVDKLRGRIGALKGFDAAKDGSLLDVMREGAVISFRGARYPQAAELAAALLLAKLMANLQAAEGRPDALVLNCAHRLFREQARFRHSDVLLTHLLEARLLTVLASTLPSMLGRRVVESFPVKVVSSEVWNAREKERVLPNCFVMDHGHFGQRSTFVARMLAPKASVPRMGRRLVQASPALTKSILEDVRRFEAPTKNSLTAFLSPHFGKDALEQELARLHAEGYISLGNKEVRAGPPLFAYSLTEKGERLLQELVR